MRNRSVFLAIPLLALCGCGESLIEVERPTITVAPGQSIQAAVDRAAPGDTVVVLPGDYTETHAGTVAVRVTKPLRLIAQSARPNARVRLLPSPTQTDGILFEPENPGDPEIDGVEITGFTVQGFPNNGIWLRHVRNFTIENNESIDNLENGIWPTLSANGLVKKNIAYGSTDSALWVEGAENVRVIENDLSKSPTGLEVTISKDIFIERNDVHDNTVGVGLYHPEGAGLASPFPPSELGNWQLVDNFIHDNNEPNSAGGGMASALPEGGGVLLLGVDGVELRRNRVERNRFFGMAMIDYCLAVDDTDFDCRRRPPEIKDTSPDNNRFIDNVFVGNGQNPPPGPFADSAGDLLGIGGKNNCMSGNTASVVSFLPELPPC